MRYRRQGIYSEKHQGWKTFYTTNQGQIKFDKGVKTHNEIRKEIGKNKVKRADDIYKRKESKIFYEATQNKRKWQREVDKLLKIKKLSSNNKEILRELKEKAGYKKEIINKKIGIKKEKIKNFIEMDIYCTFHVTTSSQFYISELSFYSLSKAVKRMIKQNGIDRLKVEFEWTEGVIYEKDFKSEMNFNHAISSIIEGYGKIPFSRGKYKIKVKGIKR